MNNPQNSYNFDSEELEILKAFENGKLNGSKPSESIVLAAQQTLKKNKNINIRISEISILILNQFKMSSNKFKCFRIS